MGLREAYKALVSRPTPGPVEAQYLSATLTTQELAETRYALRWDQQQMVARAVSEAYIALEYNAKQLSAVPIRLMRKKQGGKRKTEKTRSLTKAQKSWVRNPLVGAKAAQYAHDAEDVEEVVDSDALALLGNPNSPETGVEYMRAHWMLAQSTGCMYWLHNATRNKVPTLLERLYPQWTTISFDKDGVAFYSYGRERSKLQTFPTEQVVPFKWMPGLNNPWYGEGWIKAIAPECDSLVAAIQTSLNRWNNEGLPPFAVEMPAGSGETQLKQVREMFRRLVQGARNAGVPFIGGTGMKVQPLQWPNKDIQYLEEKKDLRETIWRAAGIPAQIMQMQSGGLSSGGESQNAAKELYAENTLIPSLGAFCERLTESYLPLFGLVPGEYWFCADNPIGDNQAEMEKSSVLLTDAGILTLNEARARLNEDPFPPEMDGDKPRYKGVLLDKMGQQPAVATGSDGKPKDSSTNSNTTAEKKVKTAKKTFYVKSLLAGSGSLACACGISHKDVEADSSVVDASPYDDVAEDEKAFEDAVRDFYRTIDWNYADGELTMDQKKERERLYAIILLFIVHTYEGGYQNGAQRLVAGVPSAVIPPLPTAHIADSPLMTYAKEEAKRAATSVVKTIFDEMKATIAKGVEAGLSTDDIRKALSEKMDNFIEWGPARVASSETVGSFTEGTIEAWKKSGVVVSKVWHTQEDEKVCPFCDALDGRTVPLGEVFFKQGETLTVGAYSLVLDYADVNGPRLHAGCRCYLDFVTEGA